ncbi:MAG: DUF433 domain-containing protein [Actinobacteria bacterium]|nr:DUF433 domain-containing protein [Actinomycetota bacterium]
MTLSIDPEPVPLSTGVDSVVRVGTTRVTLDTVVAAFREGATAEEIVQQYPTLRLADVYSVIGYCLRHQAEVEAYLHDRLRRGVEVRRENESRFDPTGIRDRLLARRSR